MNKRLLRAVAPTLSAAALALGLRASAAGVDTPRILDRFLYTSASEARAAWRLAEKSPPVELAPGGKGGLVFPCPFQSDAMDRFCWDRALNLDLSRTSSLELDLACDRPEALRRLTIYFKSGPGWYVWSEALARTGRQRLVLLKSAFATEGKPAGWDRIESIRLSPWRGVPKDTSLTLYRLSEAHNAVMILRSGAANDPAVERRIAHDAAARVSGWLRQANISHGLVDEKDIGEATFADATVVLLPYAPSLPETVRDVLKRFLERGGRLVVCYSSDEKLAAMMDVRLGPYKRCEDNRSWTSWVFPGADRWQVPERVYQTSGNIRPVYPLKGGEVLAWWENADGQRTEDPAWVRTARGLWMSHILLEEDSYYKMHMLAALLAALHPPLWPDIAEPALEQAGRIDSFRNLDEALAYLRQRAALVPSADAVRAGLAEAVAQHQALVSQVQAKQYGQAMASSRRLRRVLTEAYARVQQPAAGEFRGLWDHGGAGWYPGDWDRTCRLLKEAGFTAIFPNMSWVGQAHYPSERLGASATLRQHGDQLAQCIKAARRHGLQVHVWKVCWNTTWAPAEAVARLTREGRLQTNSRGETMPWLEPSLQANVQDELEALKEIASRYDVDGVHLDYIRYPARDAGYSAAARDAFERKLGRKAAKWPADALPGGPLAAAFEAWRAETITAFVREAAREIKAIRPSIKLSAAVYGQFPDCRASVAQDWGGWLRNGYIDFVCPMNYTENLTSFSDLVYRQLNLQGARPRVYPGLGVTANESQLMADQVIEQILSLRQLGSRGFVLFNLDPEMRDRILPALKMGVTRPLP